MDMYDTHACDRQTCTYVHTRRQVRTHARTHRQSRWCRERYRKNDAITLRANGRVTLTSRVALARIQARRESTRSERTRTGESAVDARYAEPRVSRASQHDRHCSYTYTRSPPADSPSFFFPPSSSPPSRDDPDENCRDDRYAIVLTCDVCPATSRRASLFLASGSETRA